MIRTAGASEMRARLDHYLEGLDPYCLVSVSVPPTDRLGRPTDLPRFLRAVRRCLHRVTSGTRALRTESTWEGEHRLLLEEGTVVVQAYVPLTSVDRLLDEVLPELLRIAARANQECLLIEIEGRPAFLRTAGIRALAAVPSAQPAPSRNGGRK